MRPFDFPPADLSDIAADRFHHPSPRVQRRMEVLWLTAHGVPRAEVVRLAGASRASVKRYLDAYRDGGLDAVRALRYVAPTSALDAHAPTLEAHFRDHPPRTTADARAAIERLTGVRRGLTQVRLFLKKAGPRVTARPGACRPRLTRPPSNASWMPHCVPGWPSRRTCGCTSSRPVTPELQPVESFWALFREAVANDSFDRLADLRRRVTRRCSRLAADRATVKGAIGFRWAATLEA